MFKTKRPHRVVLKDGTFKTYQPGYEVTRNDQELLDSLKYNRLYRRDIYMNKMAESYEENEKPAAKEMETDNDQGE